MTSTRDPGDRMVPPHRQGTPTRPRRGVRPRLSPDLLAHLAARLTPRDRWLLAMLHEHRVLTTTQITQLAFGSAATAAHRMHALWRLRAVDRARPYTTAGSAPMHYVLGDAGAAVLAAHHDTTSRDLGYRRDQALAILHSQKLSHTVGVNSLLAALVAHARAHPGTHLQTWWPEHRCARTWGAYVRPDAYAAWRDHDHYVDFFLEYDTGTEPLHRLTRKLVNYAALAEATGISTPVLFWFPTAAREAHARAAMTRTPLAVATAASGDTHGAPAEAVWLPLSRQPTRTSLVNLGYTPGTRTQAQPVATPLLPSPMPP